MNGVPAFYRGRIVSKEHFRTFIYAMDDSKKLVESWEEYEKHMASGLWFSSKKDAMDRIPVEKPKRTRNKAAKEQIIEEEFIHVEKEDLCKELKNDDFLPKENE